MKALPCPITPEELRRLYIEEKLTDEAIVERLGQGATLKRVRSWRRRFDIETLGKSERNEVPLIEGQLRSLLIGSMGFARELPRRPHLPGSSANYRAASSSFLSPQ